MKSVLSLGILLILLSCSNNNEKVYDEIIAQNNDYYQIKLEEYNLKFEDIKLERPQDSRTAFYKDVIVIGKSIKKVENKKEYKILFEKIKIKGYENKIGEKIKLVQSEEKILFKNNLYLNLLLVIQEFEAKNLILGTQCRLGDLFKVTKKTENDSIRLDFYTGNSYQIKIDSIVDKKTNINDYSSEKNWNVWTIKYKPRSKNSFYSGKIFFTDPSTGNYIYVQEFNTNSALEEFPY